MPRVLEILRSERPSCARRWISKMVRWSIMGCSQRIAADLPNGGRVGLRHLLRAVQRGGRLEHGTEGQRQHLKEMAIKCDEVFFDERIARHEVVIQGQLQQCTDLIEAVIGQAVAVGYKDQKDIQ